MKASSGDTCFKFEKIKNYIYYVVFRSSWDGERSVTCAVHCRWILRSLHPRFSLAFHFRTVDMHKNNNEPAHCFIYRAHMAPHAWTLASRVHVEIRTEPNTLTRCHRQDADNRGHIRFGSATQTEGNARRDTRTKRTPTLPWAASYRTDPHFNTALRLKRSSAINDRKSGFAVKGRVACTQYTITEHYLLGRPRNWWQFNAWYLCASGSFHEPFDWLAGPFSEES